MIIHRPIISLSLGLSFRIYDFASVQYETGTKRISGGSGFSFVLEPTVLVWS